MISSLVLTTLVISNCPRPATKHHHHAAVAQQSCVLPPKPVPAAAPVPEPEPLHLVIYYQPCAPVSAPAPEPPLYTTNGMWPWGFDMALTTDALAGGGGTRVPTRTVSLPRVYPPLPVRPVISTPEFSFSRAGGAVTLLIVSLLVKFANKPREPKPLTPGK